MLANKHLVLLLLFAVTFAKPVYRFWQSSNTQEQEYYITQKLSHFEPENDKTFQQRYFFQASGTANSSTNILYICGEANCPGTPNNYVQEYAKSLQANIFTLEHRYYGKSYPVKDLSTANLRHLTTTEALADLAAFIELMNEQMQDVPNKKWIIAGCSYAGAMSAWFRLKYPHLVVGALSSSGVINAIQEFYQFDEQVRESVGEACATRLQDITKALELAYKQNATQLKQIFKAPLDMEQGDFFFLMADMAAESVQYGFQIELCRSIMQPGDDLIKIYANFSINFFYKVFDPEAPLHYTTKFNQQIAIGPDVNGRQFWWQMCSELGYFQIAPATNSIRSSIVDMQYHRSLCYQLFGALLQWPPTTKFTNLNYGANRNVASNVVFANGSQDPWKRAGKYLHQDHFAGQHLLVVGCQNCGHCVDLRGCPSLPSAMSDSNDASQCTNMEHVMNARKHTMQILKEWVQ